MYLKRIAYVVFGLGVCVSPYVWGADFGTRDTRFAKIAIARPPDQLLRGRTFLVKSQNGVAFSALPALTAAINQAMSAEFSPVSADPDLTLTFSVAAYEPVATKTYSEVDRRGPGGLLTVPVTYWEARGRLSLQVSVANRSNPSIDSFSAKGEYLNKILTGENGKPNQARLPSRQEIESQLLQHTVMEVSRRYTRSAETVEVRLAVPDPLKDGLELAERGQWKEALARWTAVNAPKNAAERAYNMAVANELIFYTTDYMNNPDEGEAPAREAVRLYAEALRLDPKEKFFVQAAERSSQMQANLTRAKQQWAILQREKELLEASVSAGPATGPGAKAISGGDPADEAEFRDNVRTRLRSRSDKPAADYIANLEKTGTLSYKLQADQAKRVVTEEVTNWETFHHDVVEYRQMLSDFTAKDKTLDAKERDQLNRFAARTQLTKEEGAGIEAEFQFTDLTRPAAAPPKPVETKPPVNAAPPRPTTPR